MKWAYMWSDTSILEKNEGELTKQECSEFLVSSVRYISPPGLLKVFVLFFYSEADLKESSNKVKSNKSRSSFSVEQVLHLERVFDRQKYLGSRDRQKIAEQLQMTEAQVIQWHQ